MDKMTLVEFLHWFYNAQSHDWLVDEMARVTKDDIDEGRCTIEEWIETARKVGIELVNVPK